MSDKNEKVRLDLWLKHVCLYKHRNEATTDCNGGKIKLNGGRAKAAASIKEGDVIEFRRGDWDRKFVILGLPAKQVAKERAEEFYRDESGPRPEKQTPFERAMGAPIRDRGAGRPTKRDRRDLEREGFRRDAGGDYGDDN